MGSDVYVTTVAVADVFADASYQRPCDAARVRRMAASWDRRLAGIIEVSDRGEGKTPRFAVIDGQHRWAAAALLSPVPMLVANVHEGLTTADEAGLFDKLNRQRKMTSGWDHWKARRVAGDDVVARIERICRSHRLVVDMAAQDGCISCVSTLERVAKMGGLDQGCDLLDEVLELIVEIWERRRDSLDAPVIHGLALILRYIHADVDMERLVEVLLDTSPRRISAEANRLAEEVRGTLATRTALAIMARYNRAPGKKVNVTAKDFGGGAANARSRRQAPVVNFADSYSEMRSLGLSDFDIARKMDINLDSLVRQLHRYSLAVHPDLATAAVAERTRRDARKVAS
jgi:hypothetical protein